MRNRVLRALVLPVALGVGATATSCGGGGSGGGGSQMVLVGFNLPNIAGVALDTPLVYTFSQDVDPSSVTPDTIQVTGPQDFGFTFETIVVDGNLVAELPRIPRFEDYSDAGMFAGKTYNVFLPVFPAVDTVRSVEGHGLIRAESFSFSTTPTVSFVEPRRPLLHTPGPISGPNLRGDEDGCLQNANNELYVSPGFQFGTDADARLLCVKNEGAPHVLNSISTPKHDTRAVGTPSAVQPGFLDLPAIRVRFNEPVDPLTIVPYVPTTQLSLNVTLWRVADTDGNPLAAPEQIKTTKPTVVQDLALAEAILTAVGPQKQGTYLINISGVKDLPGNALDFSDSPSPSTGGYQAIPATLVGKVPPGYRMYFRTLELGTLPGSITENFGNNFDERTTNLFTSSTATNPVVPIPTSPAAGGTGFTLSQTQPGQATNANWNGTRRYMGRSTLVPNNKFDDGSGTLKAVFEPFLGNGGDGALTVGAGSSVTLSSDTDDGVFEYTSVSVAATGTLRLSGSKPVIILCQGAFTVNGTVDATGAAGGVGIDTTDAVQYTNSASMFISGTGGAGGPGAGAGGHGAPISGSAAAATVGGGASDTWGSALVTTGIGGAGANGNGTNQGGGGAGFGAVGSGGSGATNGGTYGTADFARSFATFVPDRNYEPNTGIVGGSGGGGGGAEDDNGASETGDGSFPFSGTTGQESGGDDGGGGGGGGGGSMWIIADSISVASGGAILANGGKGGNTFAVADQVLVTGDPMTTADDFISGVTNPTAPGTGGGGGGGGGSGGGILLQARISLTISAGSTVSAVGGAGGTAAAKNGGAGGAGRIALMTFAASGDSVAGTISVLGTVTPAAGASGALFKPTTDLTSQGVTLWFDQVTTTATYSQPPVEDDNFLTLTGAGLARGLTNDFEAILEFQGADTLTPALDVQNATAGTGITAWSSTISSLNGKRFFRFRWRFFVAHADSNAANNPDFDQNVNPMPEILSVTIPFQK